MHVHTESLHSNELQAQATPPDPSRGNVDRPPSYFAIKVVLHSARLHILARAIWRNLPPLKPDERILMENHSGTLRHGHKDPAGRPELP